MEQISERKTPTLIIIIHNGFFVRASRQELVMSLVKVALDCPQDLRELLQIGAGSESFNGRVVVVRLDEF
jgi:hypothetical protein